MVPTPNKLFSYDERSSADNASGERVVISGMSGLYPESHSVKELSDILYNKVNPISDAKSRWDFDHPEVAQCTGKVPDLHLFDAQFFKVHYRLANNMDPMARKILEQAYQAIFDAGVCLEDLNGKNVGVFIGNSLFESVITFYVEGDCGGLGIPGYSRSMFANRISYWLNAKGPSISVDEGSCSSIQALEQAYQAIRTGECDAAIVGGCNLCLRPQTTLHYGRMMKLSMDGKTKSFDSEATGCSMSEAINVLFLQKFEDALRIYAEVIHVKSRPISTRQKEETTDQTYGLYRDPVNMANFINTFYQEIQIPPQAVEYLEAFGSADPNADKAELEAIEKVFCHNRNNPLLVGSVTSNIGYSDAASGISNITKVLLGYHTGQLAGNLNCDSPRNDVAALQDGRMRILTDHHSFGSSYAAVNGISLTGVNAHVLLNGHYKTKDNLRYKTNIPHLVLVSGRLESSMHKILLDLKSCPIDPEEIALLHNIHKAKIYGHLGRGFTLLDTNEKNETICLHQKIDYFDDVKKPLWFVYSGMGSQWAGMGAQLMRIPTFAAAIETCNRVLKPKGVDIVHIITSPDETMFDYIFNSFVGITAIQIGLTDVLRVLEIIPDKIIGHSQGEIACAYADGCFTAEETILAAYCRGLVSSQTPFIRGAMAAVGIGYEQISKMCPPEIDVACHNSSNSSTISGPADIVKEFMAQLTAKEIFAKEVPSANIAFHSRYIAGAGPQLLKYLSEVITSPKKRSERWVSTSVPKEKWHEPLAKYSSAEYHTNNLLSPVLFEEASRLIPANAVLVEIAPHGLLQAILKRSLPETCKNIPLTRRGHTDNAQLVLQAIGNLFIEGYSPQVQNLYPKVEFPVSTGTPMLSHLVEWVHQEKWNVSLYETPKKKVAASSNHVISIHDDDHSYLKGHVIRETNSYPFAATLVAVWDTLALVLGVPKKQLSVQFRDVQLHSQPVLHDQRQLRLYVTVHQGKGRFEVLNENIKVATGYIIGEIDENTLPKVELQSEEEMTLKSEDIYEILSARDYNYTDDFHSIYSANLSLTGAHVLWKSNWVTLIDGLIQFNALRRRHESVSQPHFIRKIVIDIEEHLRNKALVIDDANVLPAKICDVMNSTRCGGIYIEDMKFHDLPTVNKEQIALKTLQFVPHVTTDKLDEKSALYIFLQIVAENLNKRVLNIANIVEYNQSKFKELKDIVLDIPNIRINLLNIERNDLIKTSDHLKNIDALLITNLAADKDISKALSRVLHRDTLLINKEELIDSTIHPILMYRNMCAHTIGSARLELVLWQPSDATIGTSAVTVVSQSDINKLSSQLSILPLKHRLIILTSYTVFGKLKKMIKEWRNNGCRKINLVVITDYKLLLDSESLDEMPFPDLAVNILDQGIWGGKYYYPIQENTTKGRDLALEITWIGDTDSLHWTELEKRSNERNPVEVNYVGLNDAYFKEVLGMAARKNKVNKQLIEYDFSGITERGTRVMGIAQEESIKGRIETEPDLLWPVPEYWTLEDAATVPLAYCLAFYCLCFKARFYHGISVLVHDGTGALGQAIISIALAHDCDIYTTVSDIKKKIFLLKLFPELKEDHIGYAVDGSFQEMVLNGTNGEGCNIVITSLKGDLRDASIYCAKTFGSVVDTSLTLDYEDYNFGMSPLGSCISYSTLQLSSLFDSKNVKDLKKLQLMVSEGIALGYVRPLTRLVYAAEDASPALRLQASSKHVGRVLLKLQEDISYRQQKISCSSDQLQVLLLENDILGIQLAERLISRGARNLLIHCSKKSSSLLLKLRYWLELGVQCTISNGNTLNENIRNLLDNKMIENVEGIFCIFNSFGQIEDNTKSLQYLNEAIQKSGWPIRYFAVIDASKDINIADSITLKELHEQFKSIKLPSLQVKENKEYFSVTCAIDAIEKALCHKQRTIIAHRIHKPKGNLLEDLANVADFSLSNNKSPEVTLGDLGMDLSKSHTVRAHLRDFYYISLEETMIPSLTLKQLMELDENKNIESQIEFNETDDLVTFISHIDPDELLANNDLVLLPTLTASDTWRNYEFDQNATYLCIIPGVEGLHVRFHELCKRLKLPAVVLQPGIDQPNETIEEMAQKYVKTLQKMIKLKRRFYFLGYESGILVALKMAAILENQGLTGTIFCLGGAPNEVLETFDEKLARFETEESLQVAVANHMFKLMANDNNPEDLDLGNELTNITSWKEKVSLCVQKLLGRIDHSIQYAQDFINAVYARIVQVRNYNLEPRSLRSALILIRPSTRSPKSDKSLSFQSLSQQKLVEYQLQLPLAHAAQDMRCAAIVNRHLDNDILEEFDKSN